MKRKLINPTSHMKVSMRPIARRHAHQAYKQASSSIVLHCRPKSRRCLSHRRPLPQGRLARKPHPSPLVKEIFDDKKCALKHHYSTGEILSVMGLSATSAGRRVRGIHRRLVIECHKYGHRPRSSIHMVGQAARLMHSASRNEQQIEAVSINAAVRAIIVSIRYRLVSTKSSRRHPVEA